MCVTLPLLCLCRKYFPVECNTSFLQVKNNSVPAFYTNRALCYLKLKKWEEAVKDCRRALELDSNSVKGHYFMGEAYMEQSMYDESIKYLSKGRQCNLPFGQMFFNFCSYGMTDCSCETGEIKLKTQKLKNKA